MNERIRELSEEAEEYADFYAAIADELEKDLFIRRFAELIVRECISLIEPDKEHREDASWGYIGGEEGVELLDGSVRRIKRHFGIK
jgi:hypothetical protein